jgi:hypothetical protein
MSLELYLVIENDDVLRGLIYKTLKVSDLIEKIRQLTFINT